MKRRASSASRQTPLAARVACRLETGRTHQIRVHLAHKGAPCLGDPAYGGGSPAAAVKAAMAQAGLNRQALHAAVLGFRPSDHRRGPALRDGAAGRTWPAWKRRSAGALKAIAIRKLAAPTDLKPVATRTYLRVFKQTGAPRPWRQKPVSRG